MSQMTDPDKGSIAIVADIHSTSWTPDAVLSDIENRGITQILNIGNTSFGHSIRVADVSFSWILTPDSCL